MALSSIIDSLTNSIETIAETTVSTADAKIESITRVALVLIVAIVFLIIFAVNAEYALILVGLAIAAAYLLDIDVGRGRDSSGPRK